MALVRDGRANWFHDTFREHFWITTSGFFRRRCCAA
jgi:hypothetical protein